MCRCRRQKISDAMADVGRHTHMTGSVTEQLVSFASRISTQTHCVQKQVSVLAYQNPLGIQKVKF